MVGSSGSQAGGINGLVALLREHGEAVEADLQRFYDVRLTDLTTGRLTWRRLRVLLTHLPRGSALARVQLGEDAEWGLSEQLLAATVDTLAGANWQRSGGKGRYPRPIPRPGVKSGKTTIGRSIRTPEETKAMLAKFKPQPTDEIDTPEEARDYIAQWDLPRALLAESVDPLPLPEPKDEVTTDGD